MGTIAAELPHRSHRRAGLAAALVGVTLAGGLTVFALAANDDATTPARTGVNAAESASHANERAHRQAVTAERNDPLVTRYGRPSAVVRESDDPLVSRYGRKLVPSAAPAEPLTFYNGRR